LWKTPAQQRPSDEEQEFCPFALSLCEAHVIAGVFHNPGFSDTNKISTP